MIILLGRIAKSMQWSAINISGVIFAINENRIYKQSVKTPRQSHGIVPLGKRKVYRIKVGE